MKNAAVRDAVLIAVMDCRMSPVGPLSNYNGPPSSAAEKCAGADPSLDAV